MTFTKVLAVVLRTRYRIFSTLVNLDRRVAFAIVAPVLIAGILIATFLVPIEIIALRHVVLSDKDRLDAESAVRASLIQVFGGIAVVCGFYFTARSLLLTREGHITDRYAKAIEQIGNQSLDVRIGGVYALERLARDSAVDRETILEVLTAFIREHTRTGPQQPSAEPVCADVQAAIVVLARRKNVERESKPLDFYHSGLNHANFVDGDFRNAWFYYCRLDHAIFSGAALNGAALSFCRANGMAFTGCTARNANFVNAVYTNGWFLHADLTNTDFYGCDLSGSDFGRRYAEDGVPPCPPAILANARLAKAKVTKTNLRGVDLRTVRGLTKQQLAEAITDANTLLPERWGDVDDDD